MLRLKYKKAPYYLFGDKVLLQWLGAFDLNE